MKWCTVKEAAERLRVGEGTILLRIKDSRFPHAKKNGKWLIPECCLDEDGHAQVGKPEEPEKQATGETTELVRLTQKREELKMAKEVKTLEVEIAEMDTGDEQENLAGREEASAESEGSQEGGEGDIEDLGGREHALLEEARAELERGREALEGARTEMGEREEKVKGYESLIKGYENRCWEALAAATKIQGEKWDLARFLIGSRETLGRTIKGTSKPINAKEAVTLMWRKLKDYDAKYGSWTTNERGEVLVDGKPVKSWRQEEGFYDDKNTSKIKVSW